MRYDPTLGKIVGDDGNPKFGNKQEKNNPVLKMPDGLDSLSSPQPIEVERITHERVVEARTTRLVLDVHTFDTLSGVIPDVSQREYWLSHSAAETVTNFLNGQEGQHLYILGNGNTELTHGTSIFTSTGANKTLAADKMYHFICHDDKWYEVSE